MCRVCADERTKKRRREKRRRRAEHLLHTPEHTRLRHIRHVDEDVVCRVAVQRRAQALLVEVVADETDAASENEQPVERTDLDVLIRLLRRECAGVAQQVHEAHSDAAVHVQDELQIRHSSSAHSKGMKIARRHTVSFLEVVTFSTASA